MESPSPVERESASPCESWKPDRSVVTFPCYCFRIAILSRAMRTKCVPLHRLVCSRAFFVRPSAASVNVALHKRNEKLRFRLRTLGLLFR